MNYEKIYNKFIEDRRIKEKLFSNLEYTETHHIIPKCMGGKDEKENLIRLTPEDHFFAHLLLAKTFGGKNWYAVKAMTLVCKHEGRKTDKFFFRKQFGWIKRSIAKNVSGQLNPNADKSIYKIVNLNGESFLGTRFEIMRHTNLTQGTVSSLLCGVLLGSKGWYFPEKNPSGLQGSKARSEKNKNSEILTLYKVNTAEVWIGTRFEFKQQFGTDLNYHMNWNIRCGFCKTKDGALNYKENLKQSRRKSIDENLLGKYKGINSPNRDKKVYKIEILKTKKILSITRFESYIMFGLTSADFSCLLSGKQKSAKGIRLYSENQPEYLGGRSLPIVKTLKNKHGETITGTIRELSLALDVSENIIYRVFAGYQKSIKNEWFCPISNPDGIFGKEAMILGLKKYNQKNKK